MNKTAKRNVCRMIAGLIAIDLDVEEGERRFLDKVLAKFDVPESEWDAILPLMEPDDAYACLQELSESDQQETFTLLLQAATVDDHVSEEERDYLSTVCEAIGIDDDELEDRIEQMLNP